MDDPAIVAALIAGEPGAWDLFVERHAGLVTAVVRRLLQGRGAGGSQADVDDLTENVFLMLLEDDKALLRRYDPSYRLSAYLAVLARTAVHRWLRRQKARVQLPDEMWDEAVRDEALAPVSEEARHGELRGALHEVLDRLPAKEQRVLRLYYFEGQDYDGIARTLGIAKNSVGAALTRARARLADALRQHRELTESDWKSL